MVRQAHHERVIFSAHPELAEGLNGLNVLNLHYVACIKIDTGDSKITTPTTALIAFIRLRAAKSAAITISFITAPFPARLASDVL